MMIDDYSVPVFKALQGIPMSWPDDAPLKASAVLCLLMPPPEKGEALQILFTRRSAFVNSHRGQIGFPGGRREKGDRGPVETALRETYEEIGIAPEDIRVLGSLPPIKALDLQPVIPIVGFTSKSLADCHLNPAEVASVFALPWTNFTPENRQMVRFNVFGRWRETVAYQANSHAIWGLTAVMLTRAEISPS